MADEENPSYITNLHGYLLSFSKKAHPLVDIDSRQHDAILDFDKKWEAREISGWEENSDSKLQTNGDGNAGIWCASCKIGFYFFLFANASLMQAYLQVKNIILNKLYTTPISLPKNT